MTEGVATGQHAAASPALPLFHQGKVRDTYVVDDDRLLMVASDRISAFDCILPTPIPGKGGVLTALSAFWFDRTASIVPNHLLASSWPEVAALMGVDSRHDDRAGRALLIRRARRVDVECVVRGYLAGSGWAEYRALGTLAGLPLPTGLREGDRLPAPAFTPALKNDRGHDENTTVAHLAALLGHDLARELEQTSLALYAAAYAHALARGVIVADTKFEFGLVDGQLTLIDELLTPDSSRFWPVDGYRPGAAQPSLDKQPVRDYLDSLGWDHRPPAPALPPEVIAATVARYRLALHVLTGVATDD